MYDYTKLLGKNIKRILQDPFMAKILKYHLKPNLVCEYMRFQWIRDYPERIVYIKDVKGFDTRKLELMIIDPKHFGDRHFKSKLIVDKTSPVRMWSKPNGLHGFELQVRRSQAARRETLKVVLGNRNDE